MKVRYFDLVCSKTTVSYVHLTLVFAGQMVQKLIRITQIHASYKANKKEIKILKQIKDNKTTALFTFKICTMYLHYLLDQENLLPFVHCWGWGCRTASWREVVDHCLMSTVWINRNPD